MPRQFTYWQTTRTGVEQVHWQQKTTPRNPPGLQGHAEKSGGKMGRYQPLAGSPDHLSALTPRQDRYAIPFGKTRVKNLPCTSQILSRSKWEQRAGGGRSSPGGRAWRGGREARRLQPGAAAIPSLPSPAGAREQPPDQSRPLRPRLPGPPSQPASPGSHLTGFFGILDLHGVGLRREE